MFEIVIEQTWTYRHHKRGMQTVPAGTYRVPEQMKEAVANLAIERGVGKKVEASPVKKVASRNKSRGAAPNNKATLV